jgi:hypothetical protein
MPDQEAFRNFYRQELQPLLAQTETGRKSVRQFSYILYACIAIAIVTGVVIFSAGGGGVGIIIPVVIIGVLAWAYHNRKKKFAAHFKQTIISRIVKFISPDCVYEPGSFIGEQEYENSSLYRRKHDRYNGEDFFSGHHQKTHFSCSELHTEYKTTGSKGQTHWHTIFRGLFFVADFNKHFSGRTYVWDNGNAEVSTTIVGRWFSSFSQQLEKVKLESPEFEDEFDVYSTDQVESRYLLSPALMERMVNLKTKMGCELQFSFVDTKLYMAFPIQENLFEPGIHRSNENLETAWKYVTEFSLFFEIIDELNLNRRIWTKQ